MLPWSADASRRHPPVIARVIGEASQKCIRELWSFPCREKRPPVPLAATSASLSRTKLKMKRLTASVRRLESAGVAGTKRTREIDLIAMSHSVRLASCHMHEPYNRARSLIRKPTPACIGGSQDTITCNSSVRGITWSIVLNQIASANLN
jgi:hypothetical protein